MSKTQQDVINAVAQRFAGRLRAMLTPGQWRTMRQANAAEQDAGVCHSHDYCDANEVMADAIADVTGAYDSLAPDDPREDSLIRTWNAAWDAARLAHLTTLES